VKPSGSTHVIALARVISRVAVGEAHVRVIVTRIGISNGLSSLPSPPRWAPSWWGLAAQDIRITR
jgi:hypothetical protein